MTTWNPAFVDHIEPLSGGEHMLLRIKADLEPYLPGQFIFLRLQASESSITRAYSHLIPYDQQRSSCTLYIALQAQGKFSNWLRTAELGERLSISSSSSGHFTLGHVADASHLCLFATGTGITPYLCMLQTPAIFHRFRSIHLVHGIRYAREEHFRPWISALQQQYPAQLQYHPILSREKREGWLHGHLSDLLVTGALLKALAIENFPHDTQFLLCGRPEMIRATKACLVNQYHIQPTTAATPGALLWERF